MQQTSQDASRPPARAPTLRCARVLPALLIGCAVVAGCDIFHRWDALVYRNKFDQRDALDIGTFGSLEECRAAARAKLAELKIGELGGYVCGENCMVKSGFGNLRMCARTAH